MSTSQDFVPNEEAIAEYKTELERSGEHPEVVYELGHSLTEAGKPDEAIPYLRRAAQLDPQNSNIWYNLGKARQATGDVAQAADAYRRVLGAPPRYAAPRRAAADLEEMFVGLTGEGFDVSG